MYSGIHLTEGYDDNEYGVKYDENGGQPQDTSESEPFPKQEHRGENP